VVTRSRDIDQIAERIRVLRIDFERFFNGALAVPPHAQRDRIQATLRHLRDQPLLTFADRFRLLQLEARFNSYSELYNRRLRDREEGGGSGRVAPSTASRFDPEEGVVVDGQARPEAVEALYQALSRGGEGPRFDLESFRVYLDRQTAEIRSKTGCRQVRFRLVEEGGRTKLKARPIKASP
jgi:hypothetical protein